MAAGSMTVPVIVGVAVVVAAFASVPTVGVPGCRSVFDPRLAEAYDREAADDLLRLGAAGRARNELENFGHGHALFETLAALLTLIFVESHGRIVTRARAPVNLQESSATRMS
jgi:hypothetical protein